MGFIFDGKDKAKVDDVALALNSIDSVHASIHEGNGFSWDYTNDSLGNGETASILMQITRGCHMSLAFSSEGNSFIEFYEAADGTHVVGSPEGARAVNNRNRFSSKVSPMTVNAGATEGSPLGTLLYDGHLIGGEKSKTFGAGEASFLEYILNPTYDYLLRFTNESGAAARVSVHAFFYSPGL